MPVLMRPHKKNHRGDKIDMTFKNCLRIVILVIVMSFVIGFDGFQISNCNSLRSESATFDHRLNDPFAGNLFRSFDHDRNFFRLRT